MSDILGRKIEPEDSPLLRRGGAPSGKSAPAPAKPAPAEGSPPAGDAAKAARFAARTPLYRFDQVVLANPVRDQFDTLQSRIRNHDLLYEQWGLKQIDPQGKHVAFNLYGPPGTGKTMCVEALASELGVGIIDVSYAEIESKYVGETGKNIVEVFACAKAEGALLFFDEADSILGKRMTTVTQGADHGVNVARAVMLKQLDGFDGIVGFATNLASNYDSAFVRRILMHIEIPLPDAAGRRALWRKMVLPQMPGGDTLDWDALAANSETMAGGDIKNVLVSALALVASRPEPRRRLTTDDLVTALHRARKAKAEVGSTPPRIREEILSPAEAAAQLRAP